MEYQLTQPMSDWFFWFFLAGMTLTFTSWIAFARLSMARIERAMRSDGFPDKFQSDSFGGRILFFAIAITVPEDKIQRLNQLINVSKVKSYASNLDWYLGLLFLVSGNTWILISLIAMAFDLD